VYGAAPALPRVALGRALVYAAYAVLPDGTIDVLRFYAGAGDVEHARTWARVARTISSTLVLASASLAAEPREPAPRPAAGYEPAPRPRADSVPAGWRVTTRGAEQRIESPAGSCTIVDGEVVPVWGAPGDPEHEPGTLLGDTMYWALWKDGTGRHAEALVAAEHHGYLHARCVAATTHELDSQRRFIEAQWGASSPDQRETALDQP
jgi:hypothetical protein